MDGTVEIRRERPDQAEVVVLLEALDRCLDSLDAPEAGQIETGRDQTEAVRSYQRCGRQRRGPFAGDADNGRSLFLPKRIAP